MDGTAGSNYDVDILRRIEDETLNDQELAREMKLVDDYDTRSSDIKTFYSGKAIFLTGATGFLGKSLLEKLLRTCSEITRVYILVRTKKDKSPEERLEEILSDPLFQVLAKEQPKFRSKLHIIKGNIADEAMGISEADTALLQKEVKVIFHLAATIKFDEPLKTAVDINIKGTIHLLQFARSCVDLQALVHVSTAFSNCVLTHIDERLYPAPMKANALIGLIEALDEPTLDNITPSLLGKYPNTYTYTKAITEDAVAEYGKGLPICIFRPSIVVSSYREPITGWCDNVYGPAGVVAGAGVGLLHIILCEPDNVANIVPIDLQTAAVVACAWRQASLSSPPTTDIPIYNYVSSPQNSITWRQFCHYTSQHGITIPTMKAIWYYSFRLTGNWYLYMLAVLLLHMLPALLVDGFCWATGRKPGMLKIYKKAYKFNSVLQLFTMQQWSFKDLNTRALWNDLNPVDKQLFKFDMDQVDWDMFCQNSVMGLRVYVLKDPAHTLPEARRKWRRLYLLHQGVKLLLLFLFLGTMWCLFSYIFL